MKLARITLIIMLLGGAFPIFAQPSDSLPAAKPGEGRYWIISELDTLSTHKWVWRDPSFKELVLQTPDSLPDKLPYMKKASAYDYPDKARDRQLEADVEICALIDRKGKVRAAYVRKDSGVEGLGFEEAALRVAKENRWDPAYLHGKPIALWVTYKNQFRIMITSAGDPVSRVEKWDWWVREESPKAQLPFWAYSTAPPATENVTPNPEDFVEVEELPVAIKLANPVYPQAAKAAGTESTVWVKLLISRTGKVLRAMIVKPSGRPGYGFEEAALGAAVEGKWKPAMQRGKPISVWVSYEIKFQL